MRYILVLICIVIPVISGAQDLPVKKTGVQRAVIDLTQSLEEDSDEKVAQNYLILGKELASQGEYEKAENYLQNALLLFNRLKDKEQVALVAREIAKVQEAQNKFSEAKVNFTTAGQLSKNELFKEVNQNDYQRLQNVSNPAKQATFLKRNLEILQQPEEQAVAFQQMAEINLEMNQKEEAISNLQQAIEVAPDQPQIVGKAQRNIAHVYAADSQYEKATESLKQAYDLAISQGHTLEAKQSLEMLVEQQLKSRKTTEALKAYADFVGRLETLVKADSTLIDKRFFEVHEARIAQLEKERVLKDQLIKKQNTINTALFVFIVLIAIFMLFMLRAWYSIRQRNKRIALQSLRREMNPHFIFNSLNSVNQFIAQNKELEANRYLSSYSRLMRNMMENSNKDFTSLDTEMEQLREYLELEHMRFPDKFQYEITIDEHLDAERTLIPGMLIQPQLENAIWHGLRYKEKDGHLRLSVRQQRNRLCVVVEDNGIGLRQSKELKTENQRKYNSRGISNTRERILLLNSLYHTHITLDIRDKTPDEGTGVVVTLCFPLKTVE
ncbi:two-component system sensor histidine kinase YesM [Parabacteroides sp. PFB2-12]|uniref:tetratricopeptide repeat-containing sensor histidine kinase n=1 Tax=unclassified Parabacteroides TaxID=2649774 RepID=UPI00247320AE|nr:MULTISPECIES: histidine kinase [unclassified Parabacteroides]MDH6343972.1 two-component system sensor histidine kinase YesM [Parabacteroides sp. PM6-13]MDH6391667.1 two-component system sensor histidine kinase YesM [Parabacteroides sp. PFB2-12]